MYFHLQLVLYGHYLPFQSSSYPSIFRSCLATLVLLGFSTVALMLWVYSVIAKELIWITAQIISPNVDVRDGALWVRILRFFSKVDTQLLVLKALIEVFVILIVRTTFEALLIVLVISTINWMLSSDFNEAPRISIYAKTYGPAGSHRHSLRCLVLFHGRQTQLEILDWRPYSICHMRPLNCGQILSIERFSFECDPVIDW